MRVDATRPKAEGLSLRKISSGLFTDPYPRACRRDTLGSGDARGYTISSGNVEPSGYGLLDLNSEQRSISETGAVVRTQNPVLVVLLLATVLPLRRVSFSVDPEHTL